MSASFDIKATVPVHYETMYAEDELILYRVLFGDTIGFSSIYYKNAIVDAKLFNKRVIITDSRSFNEGVGDHFLEFLATQPGTTIIDLAKKPKWQEASRFILGDDKYFANSVDAMLEETVNTLIEESLDAKNWTQVQDNVKAMLFIFETSFIVADFECRFIDSEGEIVDIRNKLYTLAVSNSNDLLLQFSGKQFQMYGNLSRKILSKNTDFWTEELGDIRDSVLEFCTSKDRTGSILELFVQMTEGIDHQNDAIIPTVQSFETENESDRALQVVRDYNRMKNEKSE